MLRGMLKWLRRRLGHCAARFRRPANREIPGWDHCPTLRFFSSSLRREVSALTGFIPVGAARTAGRSSLAHFVRLIIARESVNCRRKAAVTFARRLNHVENIPQQDSAE